MKKSALIIANWQYEDPLLRSLVSPSRDAEALAQVLGDSDIGSFDVQVLANEPSYRVCEETEAFFGDRDRDDLLLFYFSGHGVTDDDGQLYYAARNTLHKRLRSTAVSASWVNEVMNECRSRRQVLLLDCCHSGAFARTKSGGAVNTGRYFLGANPDQGRGKFILTACDAFQYSFEGETVDGVGTNSVFTDALIQGLRTGGADLDGDGLITLDELYDFVFRRVRERTPQQTPRKWASDVEGSVVIAANPFPAETPLPEDLQAAIDSFVSEIRERAIPRLEKLLRGKHRGMAFTANNVLKLLTTDDSRRVSAAASQALAAAGDVLATIPSRAERIGPIPEPLEDDRPGAAMPAPGKTAQAAASSLPPANPSRTNSAPVALPPGGFDLSRAPAIDPFLPAEPVLFSASEPAWAAPPSSSASSYPVPGAPASAAFGAPAGLPPPRWTSPEERAARLRAFGKSLAGMAEIPPCSPPTANLDGIGPDPENAAPNPQPVDSPGNPTAATSRKLATVPSAARSLPPRRLLAWAGGAGATIAVACLVWFLFVPRHHDRPAPVPAAVASQTAAASPPAAPVETPVSTTNQPSNANSNPFAANAAQANIAPAPLHTEKVHTASVHRATLSNAEAMNLITKKTQPVYPPVARAAGISGTVILHAVINSSGTVDSLRVVSGPPLLESAALDAVKTWRFRPYLLNDKPVEFETTFSLVFTVSR